MSQEQQSVVMRALRTDNNILQRDNKVLRHDYQILLQQMENQKKKNKADKDAVSPQIQALKDQIQELNAKLQDGNALNSNAVIVEKEAMSQQIFSQQQNMHDLEETVKELKVFEQKYNKVKEEKEAMTQETEALRQNIQELNAKLQDGNTLNDKFNAQMEEKDHMRQQISSQQQNIHELKESVKELKVFVQECNKVREEKEAMRHQAEALRQNIQELNEKLRSERSLCIQEQVKTSKTEEELHLQKELMHNIKEECNKLIHAKHQQHESEAVTLKQKVQYLDEMCSANKKQNATLKRENASLREKMKEQEALTLKLMDWYKETTELRQKVHEAAVQGFATELKNYNAVKAEMEAVRQKYDALQQENEEHKENLKEEKSLREQEQLRASDMEQKRLSLKELAQKLREELHKVFHLKQKLHDGETGLLNCRLNAKEEKCETIAVQKEVVCQENAALLHQILELSRKLRVEKGSFIQQQLLSTQGVEELCDQVDALQVLLLLKTGENETLQSEIQSLKLKMKHSEFNSEKLDRSQAGWTLPFLCGSLSRMVKQKQHRQAFYLENDSMVD